MRSNQRNHTGVLLFFLFMHDINANNVLKMYIRLFLLFMKNIHEESADNDSRRIRNGGQKCYLRRCAVAAVRNAAEHIAVVVCHNDTHEVG